MSKYHINKHGIPAPCKATKGNCPLGGNKQHFKTKEEAQASMDKQNELSYGLIPDVSQEQSVKEKKMTPAAKRAKEKKEFEKRLSDVLRRNWSDEKMVKHCLKSNKYVELGDSFVEVSDLKPSIYTEIWYDDETEPPERNYENFYRYNMNMNKPKFYEMRGKHYNGDGKLKMIPQYGGKDLKLALLTYDEPTDNIYKEVTEEELEQINKAIEEVQKDYEKRLSRYYKRYKDNIYVRGYWRDR